VDFDVIVIGAGIAGASAAYFLAGPRRVLVLEAEAQPGYHTTGRSAAVFAPSYGNRDVRALTLASRDFFARPPAGFADHPLLVPRGALWIARRDQIAALERLEAAVALQVPLQREDGEFARARVPVLRASYVEACLWDPEVAEIDVHALLQGFLRGVRAAGGQVRCAARVGALDFRRGRWNVRLDGEYVRAQWVVNAAGAWADTVGRLVGARPIGLQPKLRTASLVAPPEGLVVAGWPVTLDIDERFYFKPDTGSILLSPADETDSPACDARPRDLDVAVAVERFEAATTIDVRRVTHTWAGLRSFVVDRTPVLGTDPELPGFVWAAAQGGYGIQTAPAAGACVAGIVTTGDIPPACAGFGLTRAALSPARLLGGEPITQ